MFPTLKSWRPDRVCRHYFPHSQEGLYSCTTALTRTNLRQTPALNCFWPPNINDHQQHGTNLRELRWDLQGAGLQQEKQVIMVFSKRPQRATECSRKTVLRYYTCYEVPVIFFSVIISFTKYCLVTNSFYHFEVNKPTWSCFIFSLYILNSYNDKHIHVHLLCQE